MKKSGIKLWLSWTFVTTIGATLGFAISASLGPLFFWDEYGFYFILALIFISGLLIGFGQWLILRTRFKKAWGWILATAMCLPVGFYIGFF